MKAAVFYQIGAPEVLRYEEVADPPCRNDQVLVQVEAISIEGGDTLHRLGGPMGKPPHIVGYQCAGSILQVGSEVKNRAVGQRVVCCMMNGSHAEKVAVTPLSTWVLPKAADLKKAACVPIAVGTAHDCLHEFGRLQAGETVLVHAGAGGVGMAAIQLAKKAGATVLATASSDAKLEKLQTLGLDHGINYRETDFVAATMKLTGGKGADVIIESVGGKNLEKSMIAAAYRGRILFVGSAGRDAHFHPDPRLLQPGNKSLTGIFLGAEMIANIERVHSMIGALIDDVARGQLQIVIDREFPLSEAAAAHQYLEDRKAVGRVLLIP